MEAGMREQLQIEIREGQNGGIVLAVRGNGTDGISGVTDGVNEIKECGQMRLTASRDQEEEFFAVTGMPGEIEGEILFPLPESVRLWNPENPCLYDTEIRGIGDGGEEKLFFAGRIGFRTLRREGRRLYWNGTPVRLRGVCYRERQNDWEGTRRDLELFAAANVNFLRSIYGPFSDRLLSLCDEMGFLVEETAPFYEVGTERLATQDLPHCREEYLLAVQEMYAQGASHVCVLLWSLGHDCAWGANFSAAADWLRAADSVRPLTFHLPMSIPEQERQMDVWPVQYVDWRLPFDVCYDQMVIFHTPGEENEIGYETAQAEYEVPVLHEVWAPVACHDREEIDRDPSIRRFWGESIRRFVQKAYRTDGCLGGAVLAGVDEDGSFEGMGEYRWGILDRDHQPKPEYDALREAYAPAVLHGCRREADGSLSVELESRLIFTGLEECELVCGDSVYEAQWTRQCRNLYLGKLRQKQGMEATAEQDAASEESRQSAGKCSGGAADEARPSVGKCSGGAGAGEEREQKDSWTLRLPTGRSFPIPWERQETVEFEGSSDRECGVQRIRNGYSADQEEEEGRQSGCGEASSDGLAAVQSDQWQITETPEMLDIRNDSFCYRFSQTTCMLTSAFAGGGQVLAGGPSLSAAGLLLGTWEGRSLAWSRQNGAVLVDIRGAYRDTLEIRFLLRLLPDGQLDAAYEVEKLFCHMPHTVKAGIGVSPGGLSEKGISFLLSGDVKEAKGARFHVCGAHVTVSGGAGIGILAGPEPIAQLRIEEAPELCPEAVVDDRDARMVYTGSWQRMDDDCGNLCGTETVSRQAGDTMCLSFCGSGIRLYGATDLIYGRAQILIDGEQCAQISQYPDKVDFPGMSRGYEKRYRTLLFEAHGLEEGEHLLEVRVLGEADPGAQNTYTAIDYAVLEGASYPKGSRLMIHQDYNYPRLVRGNYMRPKVTLTGGERQSVRLRLTTPQ
ncbi:MAG: glycoside hydrolase family 2 TIM barrel-domain containing protein [Eubacteriales bacterium]|nr:glycoside hydrolase family 2 TIM barrel-domain containing protein [Eubacteriales bacterium]